MAEIHHVQLRILRQLLMPCLPNGCNCPYFNFLLHIIAFYLIRGFNDLWSRLHKTRKLHLRISKFRDVIWIVMELSFMLLRRLQQLISSCRKTTSIVNCNWLNIFSICQYFITAACHKAQGYGSSQSHPIYNELSGNTTKSISECCKVPVLLYSPIICWIL